MDTPYAYTADRDAQWYQAAGLLSNNSITAKLDVFEGGTAFGQPYQAAVHLGSVGNVTLKFASPTVGSIQFPGEPAKAFSRFNFARPVAPSSLDGTYVLERTTVKLASNSRIYDSKLDIAATGAMVINGSNVKTRFALSYNGNTQTVSNAFTIVERDVASITVRTADGSQQTRLILVKQGDELITLGLINLGMETDYWRRTSATPNELALRSLPSETPETYGEKVLNSHPPGLAMHEMQLE